MSGLAVDLALLVMQARSDTELVMASRQGQVAAFGELVERYQTMVCGVSFSAGGDRALSEDIAQETFVAAWSSLGELREPGKVRAWLCQIARNLTSKALRGKKREVVSDLQFDESMSVASPVDSVLEKESSQLVWDALEKIPQTYREPLVLFYCQEQSSKQVAEQLDLTEAAVQQRLSRGRQYLKDSVAARVEHARTKTTPTKSIAAAVVALSGGRTATSANAATATSSSAKPGLSKMTISKVAAAAAIAAITAGGLYWHHEAQSATTPSPAVGTTTISPSKQSTTYVAPTAPPSLTPSANQPCPTCTTHGSDDTQSMHGARNIAFTMIGDPSKRASYDVAVTAMHRCLPVLHLPNENSSLHLQVFLQFDHSPSGSQLRAASPFNQDPAITGVADFEPCVLSYVDHHPFESNLTDSIWTLQSDTDANERATISGDWGAITPPSPTSLGGPSRGPTNAPIKIVEFTDFHCLYCAKVLATIDQLIEDYPGKILLVSKLDPIHPESRRLAQAAAAADLQGKYWPMHDLLLAYQDEAGITDAQLVEFASQIGLDVERFKTDLEGAAVDARVQAELSEARHFGVVATPTIFINDDVVQGAQSIDVFKKIIDRDLAAAPR